MTVVPKKKYYLCSRIEQKLTIGKQNGETYIDR